MPRGYPYSHTCHGHFVGFNVAKQGADPCYFAQFRSKDGRRLKRDTKQIRINAAIDAARAIIEKEYEPATADPDKVTWDEATERLEARLATAGKRPGTAGYYLKLIRLFRKLYPSIDGPADVTPSMAARWRDWMMSTPGRRKSLPSAHYVRGLVIGLSALWQAWFVDDMKIVPGNPWQDVEPPTADKLTVRYATDEQIDQFNGWLAERFGDWPFARLFLATKAYTACRLMDLCRLRSRQLREGRIVFAAKDTKGRKERAIQLPEDLYAALDGIKGPGWLWEGYTPGLRAALAAKGFPTHQLKTEFSPERLYYWIETLFSDYRKAFPDRPRLTSHMYRKRAFTRAWNAGLDARRAAIAYGCNVDTLMKHYVGLDEQQVTDEVFAAMATKDGQI